MKSGKKRKSWIIGLLLLMPVAGSGYSGLDADELVPANAVADQELDGMRGGFITDNGLQISFGIERAIYVNGSLQAVNSFSIPQLGTAVTPETLDQLQKNMFTLVQNGPGNSISPVAPANSGLLGGLVVQNSLDNQLIQPMTVINAAVRNMDLFRGMNLASTMRQQMIAGSR